MTKIYTVVLEIEDLSETDGEDIELRIEDTLREGLPESLQSRIVSFDQEDQ